MFYRDYEDPPTYINPLSTGMDIGSWAAKVKLPRPSTIVLAQLYDSSACTPCPTVTNMFQAEKFLCHGAKL